MNEVEVSQMAESSAIDRPSGARLGLKDAIALLFLCATLLVYARLFVNLANPPDEDAAMLMRYARNLASGHGVVWNIGSHPVDGATDFLFMAAISGLMQFGLGVLAATRGLILICHALTVLLTYIAVRKLHESSLWMALFTAVYFALGPGFRYVEADFGTPFFALAVAATFWLAEECRRAPQSWRHIAGFAFTSLVLGLIRPEGVFLAALMLLGLVSVVGLRNSQRLALCWTAVYLVLGGAYFAWHWRYFGYPFPNPYYIKGGNHLHFDALRTSIFNVVQLCLPFLPLYLLGLFSSRGTRRLTVFTLIPVGGFTAIWVLLSREMNYLMRFQYAVVPLVLIAWPGLAAQVWEDWQLPSWHSISPDIRRRARAVGAILSVAIILWQIRLYLRSDSTATCNAEVALMLHDYSAKGYGLATTEAGIVPLYSGWRALDTYGLNDRELAHGADLIERLDSFRPQVIEIHITELHGELARFEVMERRVKAYAEQRGYRLAAAFGLAPSYVYLYYVQPDFPQSDEVARRIQTTWKSNPRGYYDFANFKMP